MAKTYYSTRPPSLNTDVASQPVAALPTTQVNIPGNYYLKVNQETGTIDVEAGSDISIDSGSIVEIRAIEAVVSRAPVTRVIGSTILGSQLNLNIVKFQSRVESDIFPKGDNSFTSVKKAMLGKTYSLLRASLRVKTTLKTHLV
jgi:hypothetical protein